MSAEYRHLCLSQWSVNSEMGSNHLTSLVINRVQHPGCFEYMCAEWIYKVGSKEEKGMKVSKGGVSQTPREVCIFLEVRENN